MSDWTVENNTGDPVDITMDNGERIQLAPGEARPFDSACRALEFLSKRTPGVAVSEINDGALDSLLAAGQVEGCSPDGSIQVTPGPAVPPPPAQESPPPTTGDSADLQGAPATPPPLVVIPRDEPEAPPDPDAEPRDHPDGGPDPVHARPRGQQQVDGGDPVDLFTGALVITEVDLSLRTATTPIELMRSYRSDAHYFGPFGWSWDHSHNQYLRPLGDGAVAWWTGALQEVVFRPDGADFTTPSGHRARLEALPGGDFVLHHPAGDASTFRQPPGWGRADRLPLVRMSDRHGNTATYTYDVEDRLVTVIDDDARGLTFGYGDCGLLEQVSDHAGRTVHYVHAEDVEHLACVAVEGAGPVREYAYVHPGTSLERRHQIVSVTGGDGATFTQVAYDEDPASWSHGRVVEQLHGDQLHQFRATLLQWTPRTMDYVDTPSVRVEVLDPELALTTSTFNSRGDLLDVRQRLTVDGSYRVVSESFGYDAEGNRIRIRHADGGEELRVYDDGHPDPARRGHLLRRELRARSGFPSPSRIVWRGTYEATYGLPSTEVDERGHVVRYRYDLDDGTPGATGRMTAIEFEDGAVQRFESDVRGRLAAVTSPAGARSEVTYGAAGAARGLPERVVRDVTGAAATERLSYDEAGNIVAVLDAEGAERTYDHDAFGRLVLTRSPVVGGSASEVRLTRDVDGVVTSLSRPRGAHDDPVLAGSAIRDELVHDVLGNLVSATLGVNTDAPRRLTRHVDSRGLVRLAHHEGGPRIEQCFDERGLLVQRTETGEDGTRRCRRFSYDRVGRTVTASIDDEGVVVVRHEHDAFGRLLRSTTPDGTVVSLVHGADDLLLEERVEGDPGDGTHRLLRRTRHTYDVRGRLATTSEASYVDDPGAAVELVTSHTYDADGNLASVTGPHGASTHYRHDALGRLVEVVDDQGNRVESRWDRCDRLVATIRHDVTGPVSSPATVTRTWAWQHDVRGRVVREIDPLGNVTRTDHDDRDLPVARVSADGVRAAIAYGPHGERRELVTDADGAVEPHAWAYDVAGRLARYEDPGGQITTIRLDGLGREVAREGPAGSLTREFGPDGRLVAEVHPSGSRLVFEHDLSGRVSAVEGMGAAGVDGVPRTRLRYDGLGRLVRAAQSGQVVERSYDSLGRLVAESLGTTMMQVTFDDVARTATRRWPDGRSEETRLDAAGRPTAIVRTGAGALGAGPAGIASFETTGGDLVSRVDRLGIGTAVSHDLARRVTELETDAAGGPVDRRRYRFDVTGRRGAEDALSPGSGRTWSRDDARRTVRVRDGVPAVLSPGTPATQAGHDAEIASVLATPGGAEFRYAYAAADDRLSADEGTGPVPYSTGPGHRLVQVGPAPVTHHPDGTRAADGRWRYVVDALGRVTSVSPVAGGPPVVEISYDPLGRPSTIAQGADVRRLRYCGAAVVQEDVAGSPERQLTPHPWGGPPLVTHVAGTSYAGVHDLTGSRVALVRTDGVTAETCHHDPFGWPTLRDAGGATTATSPTGLEPCFAGLRWLGAAGLYLSPHRLYDPTTGLWLQPDPMGLADGPNPYAYARHDPADLVDPTGELAFLAVLGIMAVGALVGGGLNAVRQGIAISEGAQDEFSWGELAFNAGAGAVLAPIAVVAPEVVIPLAGMGIANGVGELSEGNYATGTFDIVTSVVGARGAVRSPSFRAPVPTRITNLKVTIARTDLNQREALLWGRRALVRNPDTRNNISNEIGTVRLARAILDNPDLPVTSFDPATRTASTRPLGFDPARDLGWDGLRIDQRFLRPGGDRGGDLDISLRTFDIEVKLGERASDTAHKVGARNASLPERAGLPYFLASDVPPDVMATWLTHPRAVPGDVRTAFRHGFDGHIQVEGGVRTGRPHLWSDLWRIDIPHNVRPSILPQRK